MKFLQNNSRFLGTGENNQKGQSLDTFLENYDPKKYDCPCNTVDILVFRLLRNTGDKTPRLKLLMIRRGNHPSIGSWALPGGFVNLRENLEDAAARELEEETGVHRKDLIQLKTYGDYDRDPRWRVITTAYIAVLDEDTPVRGGDDAADAVWMDVQLTREVPAPDSSPAPGTVLYTLTLNCPERSASGRSGPERSASGHSLKLNAVVEETSVTSGLLHSKLRKLISADGIASDHGLIITEAVLLLKQQLMNS